MQADKPTDKNRETPDLIVVTCVFGILNAATAFEKAVEPQAYAYYDEISFVLPAICMIGLWKMRVWAVFGYVSIFIVNQVLLVCSEEFFLAQAMLPTLLVTIAFKYLNRMG